MFTISHEPFPFFLVKFQSLGDLKQQKLTNLCGEIPRLSRCFGLFLLFFPHDASIPRGSSVLRPVVDGRCQAEVETVKVRYGASWRKVAICLEETAGFPDRD
jgi:hypothetical protein